MLVLLSIFIVHLLAPGPSFFFLMLESMMQGRAYGVKVAQGLAFADLVFACICAFAFYLLSGIENSSSMAYLMILGGIWFLYRAIIVLVTSKKRRIVTIDEASRALGKELLSPKYSEELKQEVEEAKAYVQLQKEIEGVVPISNSLSQIMTDEKNEIQSKEKNDKRMTHAFITGIKAGVINIQAIMFFLAMAVAGNLHTFSWEKKMVWICLIAATSLIVRQLIAYFFTTNQIFNFFKKNQLVIQAVVSFIMIIFSGSIFYSAYEILKVH